MASNEQRLRRMVGDRIPPGDDGGHAFFDEEEITDLITESGGDLNSAALNGWLAKMAEFAKLIDTDISGANRELSQMFKHAEVMARHYAGVIGADAEALIGRVVGRAINLRETGPRAPATTAAVMTGSGTFRSELHNAEARRIMQNSHPDTTDADPSYPQPGAVAT